MVEKTQDDCKDCEGCKSNCSVPKDIQEPRFKLVETLFDRIDTVIAEEAEKYQFSLFEYEILATMLRKKIDHIGLINLITSMTQGQGSSEPNSNMFQ